jgi:hypothetical protein
MNTGMLLAVVIFGALLAIALLGLTVSNRNSERRHSDGSRPAGTWKDVRGRGDGDLQPAPADSRPVRPTADNPANPVR